MLRRAALMAALPVSAAAGGPTVTLPGLGTLVGKADAAVPSVSSFLGVPYAEPVSGEGRWRPPTAKKPWAAPLSAEGYGPVCYGSQGFGCVSNTTSEDCLSLNVFTPANAAAGADLAVMVWFHGGGFCTGCSDNYLGANLVDASGGKVVVVTVNYRLNIFGFLASEQLRGRSGDNSTGNYGLRDQRLSMQWVKDHIRSFGGNPDNVMIFGESAGSASIGHHLVAQRSFGLFHKGGMESGAPGLAATVAAKEANFQDVLKKMGCADVDCLLKADAGALEGATGVQSGMASGNYGPVIDGVELLGQPGDLMKAGRFAKVPVLLGTNRDEVALFPPFSVGAGKLFSELEFDTVVGALAGKDKLPQIKQLYDASTYKYPADLLGRTHWWWAAVRASTDATFTCPTRQTGGWVSAAAPVYRYNFAYPARDAVNRCAGLATCPPAAGHASEIPFVFDAPNVPLSGKFTDPAERALAQQMSGYWTRFAQTGDPNGAGAPAWPQDSAAAPTLLELDVAGRGPTPRADFRTAACDFWDSTRQ